MTDLISSNGVEIEVGQVVIYSDGSVMSKCIVRKINMRGKSNKWISSIWLEVVQSRSYPIGYMFKHAKPAIRMWVLDETSEQAVETMILYPFKYQKIQSTP